jgi:hypothetical protein
MVILVLHVVWTNMATVDWCKGFARGFGASHLDLISVKSSRSKGLRTNK